MLKMFGIGGSACPRCEHRGEQKREGQAAYCAGCGLLLGAPRHKPVLVDNRWAPGQDELAVFFGVRALSGIFVKTLHVPATARAYILQGGQATEVPQGEYEIEGFFTRLNNLLRDQHAEILVTRSGALPVEFSLQGLTTCEHLLVDATLTLSLKIENVPAFARHFMTMPGTIKDEQLRELIAPSVAELAQEFVGARSLRDMAGQRADRRELRLEFDQHLQGGLALLLSQYGLAVVRVDTIALKHDKFDADRAGVGKLVGTLWLAADEQRVRIEHAKLLDELYDEREWQRIRREEQEARLRHRRAELRQEESLERAGLSLKNAERAQAIRGRQIELYGRIVESRTRKQAIERGAVDAVAALEHELAGKRNARQDEAAQWQQTRELAAIRLRTELEVAQQEAAQSRAFAQQRFAHQLLQQQIRNKIEQARGIEDASRQRAELARLHEAEQAAARREREIQDEEHAARLKLLQLENAAHRREAERVLEWQDAQAAGRLSLDAEQVRQQLDSLRREGASQDALAQHDKLLRTIEADAIAARNGREGEREQREHELALARAEIERLQALGALDDGAKVALVAPANAALLADVMKTRVHAGMSAEQLAALAGVVGVANTDAWRLAQEQVAQERARRDAQEERERRHQLELLALQNDVNKTALASQAQLGAGVAGAIAGALAGTAGASAACRHADAHAGDRYCGACGAPLPARG